MVVPLRSLLFFLQNTRNKITPFFAIKLWKEVFEKLPHKLVVGIIFPLQILYHSICFCLRLESFNRENAFTFISVILGLLKSIRFSFTWAKFILFLLQLAVSVLNHQLLKMHIEIVESFCWFIPMLKRSIDYFIWEFYAVFKQIVSIPCQFRFFLILSYLFSLSHFIFRVGQDDFPHNQYYADCPVLSELPVRWLPLILWTNGYSWRVFYWKIYLWRELADAKISVCSFLVLFRAQRWQFLQFVEP